MPHIVQVPAHAEITKMPHQIIWPDNFIPAPDHGFVHFFNSGKRSAGVFDDIFMIKVVISRYK
jgi:hypothetical protein